jgi:hypothetical protein
VYEVYYNIQDPTRSQLQIIYRRKHFIGRHHVRLMAQAYKKCTSHPYSFSK